MLLIQFWHTCCFRTPADIPTRSCIAAVTSEPDVYDVGFAYDRGWQGGAFGLPHQSCTVSIRNCQVVAACLGVECDEL